MGVFNRILSGQACPRCGALVEWQSKELRYSGLLLDNVMDTIDLRPEMDGEMHAVCDGCKVWIDAEIADGRIVRVEARELQAG